MFKGAMTAIVTPFNEDGSLDLESLKKFIDFQINNNIDGLVPCGTTGESPTLEFDEHKQVVKTTIEQANGKVPIIAGAGSNSTKHAVELTKLAADLGANATLHVCPYYNKPTQEGLFRHYSEIAKAADIPVVVYNIKGRTAINMETATLARLQKEHSNIAAVKEASGDINQMQDVINTLPKDFDVLSGDDSMTVQLMKIGGKGIISVASNIIPQQVHDLTQAALDGDFEKAEQMNKDLTPLFEGIFIETNPIPIKAGLVMKGMIKESYRLPMCEMQPENKEKLKKILTDAGAI
jgi:4-hydroxy-tetrahydrodipicolinate synthase|tara:strand:- start:1521 stop:2399 length:879 start_codon:yes stop_codon:yes gene_type:complete